jgi:hypothetical protein
VAAAGAPQRDLQATSHKPQAELLKQDDRPLRGL